MISLDFNDDLTGGSASEFQMAPRALRFCSFIRAFPIFHLQIVGQEQLRCHFFLEHAGGCVTLN